MLFLVKAVSVVFDDGGVIYFSQKLEVFFEFRDVLLFSFDFLEGVEFLRSFVHALINASICSFS